MPDTDLSRYTPGDYYPGPLVLRAAWYLVSLVFFENGIPFPSSLKRTLLKVFRARIGRGVVIKPRVRIKYPWFLSIGEYTWIGEEAWLDNIAAIDVQAHVCISQGAYLCTGNHDYSKPTFDLRPQAIKVERGAWIGARALICPGVTVGSHAVASAGSVVNRTIVANTVVCGNPATFLRNRPSAAETVHASTGSAP